MVEGVYKNDRRVGTLVVSYYSAGAYGRDGMYGYVTWSGGTVTLTPEECIAPGQVLDVMFGSGWTYDVPERRQDSEEVSMVRIASRDHGAAPGARGGRVLRFLRAQRSRGDRRAHG